MERVADGDGGFHFERVCTDWSPVQNASVPGVAGTAGDDDRDGVSNTIEEGFRTSTDPFIYTARLTLLQI